jgi:hypothetical protein
MRSCQEVRNPYTFLYILERRCVAIGLHLDEPAPQGVDGHDIEEAEGTRGARMLATSATGRLMEARTLVTPKIS